MMGWVGSRGNLGIVGIYGVDHTTIKYPQFPLYSIENMN